MTTTGVLSGVDQQQLQREFKRAFRQQETALDILRRTATYHINQAKRLTNGARYHLNFPNDKWHMHQFNKANASAEGHANEARRTLVKILRYRSLTSKKL